MNLYTVNSPAE